MPESHKVCSVYIKDGVIASTSTAPEGFLADKTIYGSGKMLIPGMINAHTHGAMSLLRNCADDLLFNDWLFGRIFPLEEKLTGDDCYWGMMLSIMEMLRSGTTSFIDMYYFIEALSAAVKDSGIRAVLSRGLISDASDKNAGRNRLDEAINAINRWSNVENLSFMIAPHAPYTCDEDFQREIAQEAKQLGVSIKSHLSESLTEIKTIREKYNCSPIELYDKTGLLSDTTLIAHCVHVSDSDIDIIAKRGAKVATNPVSNLQLATGVAPVPKMINAGITVALGTDGAASNNRQNMLRELSVLTLIHKGANPDALAVSSEEGFKIATKNGALAMGRTDLGEIKAGNIADLVILNLDHPNMQPVNNPIAALAYSANGSEVETVMVGGRILMENREFTTIDEDKVYHEVSNICKRIGTSQSLTAK
jgi:5-methylthioadenosine/S-adenosylhomocysteine deaminase